MKDLTAAVPGRTYFDHLRHQSAGAIPISGMESFGLLAFETTSGQVAFLKDDKTLLVDATGLSPRRLPSGTSRQDVAYAVAAAVIGCWNE